MDQDFKTTFIPKKPVAVEAPHTASRPTGFLTVIALLIFLVTLVLGGGVFFYEEYLATRTKDLVATIAKEQKDFEISTITDLKLIDKRLSVAGKILDNHNAISPFFRLLEDTTLPTVRFLKFDFSMRDGSPKVALSGEATGYQAIAQQSHVFGQHSAIRDHIFSNFILTPRGRVSFDLAFNVDPSLLDFETQVIEGGISRPQFISPQDLYDVGLGAQTAQPVSASAPQTF